MNMNATMTTNTVVRYYHQVRPTGPRAPGTSVPPGTDVGLQREKNNVVRIRFRDNRCFVRRRGEEDLVMARR